MIAYRTTQLDQTDSTNNRVKELLAADEAEGAVVVARRQVGGYGRRGHAWESPEGGLYCSVLLRPGARVPAGAQAELAAKVPTLSLVAGLAVRRGVCRVLAPEAAAQVKVKWPNDVLVARGGGFAKLCGISLEGMPEGLCLGVGVNVADAGPALACVQQLPGGAGVSVRDVAASVLDAFAEMYEAWLVQPFAAFRSEFDDVSALVGRMVSVREGADVTEGVCAGVDEHGRLLLRQADGTLCAITSGEAHIERIAP